MRPWGRLLLVFLDGVGIGEADPDRNPFARAAIPTLLKLMGGKLPSLAEPSPRGPHGTSFPLDANLETEGVPQSGTGQASLLTGENAARLFGRHFGPWTPVSLRPLVEERSILRAALDGGRATVFANAYPRGWPGPRGRVRVAGPPLAARGAGLLDRHEEALAAGTAVSSEMVNEAWRAHFGHRGLPLITEAEAGMNLGRIAAEAELTFWAYYATDTAGHRGGMEGGVAVLERVDRFLAGLLETLPPDVTLLLASDHGNLEDVTGGHTRNPVLGVAAGPGAEALAGRMRSLTDVSPAIRAHLGLEA
ncbi:MAG: alkaline phosphatase family protein [Longimicrobiales bacterium]